MTFNDDSEGRKFHRNQPRTPEETVAAIYEELSVTPLNNRTIHPEQTVKGYLGAMHDRLVNMDYAEKAKKESKEGAEAVSLGVVGLIGLLLVFVSANAKGDSEWWRTYSYFFFVLGTVLTVMFCAACMEKSLPVSQMLKFNSVKILCAFIFSAALVYASSQASGLLNSIFRIDGSNLPYTRAILAAVYFLKMCTPFLFVLALFAAIDVMVVWAAARDKEDVFLFPWISVMFIVGSLVVAGLFWWITHGAFGDEKMKQKAYKLAHYLDFSEVTYCVKSADSREINQESYLFFGQDQNKILIDQKLDLKESFEEFLKGNSIFGDVVIPIEFKVMPCSPNTDRLSSATESH